MGGEAKLSELDLLAIDVDFDFFISRFTDYFTSL